MQHTQTNGPKISSARSTSFGLLAVTSQLRLCGSSFEEKTVQDKARKIFLDHRLTGVGGSDGEKPLAGESEPKDKSENFPSFTQHRQKADVEIVDVDHINHNHSYSN